MNLMVSASITALFSLLSIRFKFPRASSSLPHDLAWKMRKAPAYGYHAMTLPIAIQDRMFEQDEQIMGNHADTIDADIRLELSAWHTFHTKADLQLFDTIFGDFAALTIPNQGSLGRFGAVACNNVIPRLVIEQSSLVFVLHDNQPERF